MNKGYSGGVGLGWDGGTIGCEGRVLTVVKKTHRIDWIVFEKIISLYESLSWSL
jgi:hypothetical protein